MPKEIVEWRGCKDLVAAEVLSDTSSGISFGEVFDIAGLAEITRTTENSSETHYYDDKPAIVVTSTGADTVTVNVSAIPMDVLATITGQTYDETKGVFIEGERTNKYFALGYKTSKTNGDEVYVWRLKGSFSIPDSQHVTMANDATANGQSITYTGISTTSTFTSLGNKSAKAINVDVSAGLTDVDNFFDSVQTPDTLVAAACAAPTATPSAGEITSGYTVYLSTATDGASIYYTTDGTTPTAEDTLYDGGIIISANTTVKAIAIKQGLSSSTVSTFAYTV